MSDQFEMNNQPERVEKDIVVGIDYTLHVEGELVDSSEGEPLEYLQGHGQIIPGLEKALDGMKMGENKEVHVTAREAYGMPNPDAFVEVSRAEFPADFPVEAGTPIQVRSIDGEVMDARIVKVEDERVLLDFNHPLAGKELDFNVTVVSLRAPTAEEMLHGHAHGAGADEEDEEFEDGDFDEEDFEDEEE